MTAARRLIGKSMANDLEAFVVPETRVARACGLDIESAGLEAVANPRHASVLLVIGQLPNGLAEAAAIAYAQMPRPRLILAVGADTDEPLPPADITTTLDQQGLEQGVLTAKRMFFRNSWSPRSSVFEIPAENGDDHDAEVHDHDHMAHDDSNTHDMSETRHQPDHDESDQDQGGDNHDADHGDVEHGDMDHGSMHHGGMDHGDGGFMSMIAMTKDLPRSPDGLPMEWVQTPFGPLFNGLPAGLAPTLTLDGDVVAGVDLAPVATRRSNLETLEGPIGSFPDRLSALDPLGPVAYRLLAERALEAVAGDAAADDIAPARVGALERERAASHLGWLAAFGELLGLAWLSARAAELQLALVRAEDIAQVTRLLADIDRFARRAEMLPLLRKRLVGIGRIDPDSSATMLGPVARAAGVETDVRSQEEPYQSLTFAPVVRNGSDAWSRYQVRLAEISQSLDFVAAASACTVAPSSVSPDISGHGTATIETPRGRATLEIEVHEGSIRSAELETPSTDHAELVPAVAEGAELADALVGIASLDISPWEIDR